MKRAEVWWVNFDPSVGTEIRKRRPAIIVSNDAANLHLSRVTVIPVTSNTGRVYPSEAIITIVENSGVASESKAMADQLQTIDKSRIVAHMGRVSREDMLKIHAILRLHLGL